MAFIQDMELVEFCEFIQLAMKKDEDDRFFLQWCSMLPSLVKYVPYGEFKDMLTGANIDMRPAEVIMAEIEELHRKAGDYDGS